MKKKRRYDISGIQWSEEHIYRGPRRTQTERPKEAGPTLMPDIKEFVAPGMVPISSRSQLREYEQRTGTRQVGNDFSLADFDVSKRAPNIDQKKIDQRAYEAIQRYLG